MAITNKFWKYIGERIISAYEEEIRQTMQSQTSAEDGTDADAETDADTDAEDTSSALPPVEVARRVLEQLHCEVTWDEKEDSVNSCDITYQGGHFMLRVWDRHPYALLMYPCFYAADSTELELVRSVINRVNTESILTRVVTGITDKTGEVQCHIMVCVMLDEVSPTRVRAVTDALNSCFGVRRDFDKYFTEAKASGDDDPELDDAHRRIDHYLLGEQAWNHYEDHVRVKPSDTARFTISEMMRRIFDWNDVESVSLRIVIGNQVVEMPDAGDFEPLDALVEKGGTVIAGDAVLLMEVRRGGLTFFDENVALTGSEPGGAPQRLATSVTAMMHVTHSDSEAVYVRVTLTHDASDCGEIRSLQHPEMKGNAVTFIIARDLADDTRRQEEFRFMLDEARDNLRNGRVEQLTDIQEHLLANDDDVNNGYHLYWGRCYARHRRYAEALVHYLTVYESQKAQFMQMNKRQRKQYYDVMYNVGMCYARLGQAERAYFFLDAAAQTNQTNYIVELINCMINSGAPLADQVLTNVSNHMQEQIEEHQDDEDGDIEAANAFVRFLNMRRAYLFIEQKRWDEAEDLLNQLLKDEETEEFAMNELAYMATIRNIADNAPKQ